MCTVKLLDLYAQYRRNNRGAEPGSWRTNQQLIVDRPCNPQRRNSRGVEPRSQRTNQEPDTELTPGSSGKW